MNIPDLIPLFNNAILNKDEINLFLIGQKIARKYSYSYYKKFNITCDYELIADEVTDNLIRVVKETNWKKGCQYYFGCIKTGTKFKYLNLLKEPKTFSLEAISMNQDGDDITDHLNLKPCISERNSTEELILSFVHKAIELADNYLDKKAVEKKLGIDHKLFLFICKKYGIQFAGNSLRLFLDAMRFYNIYQETGCDLQLTRTVAKARNLSGNVLGSIRIVQDYLDMWKNRKETFMNRLIYPPNQSSPWAKF